MTVPQSTRHLLQASAECLQCRGPHVESGGILILSTPVSIEGTPPIASCSCTSCNTCVPQIVQDILQANWMTLCSSLCSVNFPNDSTRHVVKDSMGATNAAPAYAHCSCQLMPQLLFSPQAGRMQNSVECSQQGCLLHIYVRLLQSAAGALSAQKTAACFLSQLHLLC